jgi:hypothetical protein
MIRRTVGPQSYGEGALGAGGFSASNLALRAASTKGIQPWGPASMKLSPVKRLILTVAELGSADSRW